MVTFLQPLVPSRCSPKESDSSWWPASSTSCQLQTSVVPDSNLRWPLLTPFLDHMHSSSLFCLKLFLNSGKISKIQKSREKRSAYVSFPRQ